MMRSDRARAPALSRTGGGTAGVGESTIAINNLGSMLSGAGSGGDGADAGVTSNNCVGAMPATASPSSSPNSVGGGLSTGALPRGNATPGTTVRGTAPTSRANGRKVSAAMTTSNANNSGADRNNPGSSSAVASPGVGSAIGNRLRRLSARRRAAQQDFHPKLITSQIVALQCLHYFLLGVMFQINSVLFNTSITIDRIFTDRYVRLWKSSGWPDVLATLLGSAAGSLLLALIVEKSKKCLDFSVTLFLIHLLVCTFYGGVPGTSDWWIVHISGTILMVLLGEYLCSRRELDDIPLLQL